jgi:hypothetical protein
MRGSVFFLSVFFVALTGCSESGLADRRVGVLPDDVGGARANWVDEDTNGVGTHRVTASALNVRTADLSQVSFTAVQGEQLVITGQTQESNGFVYQEAVFKGGDVDGQYGWVATDYLAHTRLQVCGNDVAVRGESLGTVLGTADRGDDAYVVSRTIRNTGNHRYFKASVNGIVGYVATDFLCRDGTANDGSRVGLANALLDHHHAGRIHLWEENFGRNDGASPYENVADAAAGLESLTSCDGNSPCSSVYLDVRLLDAMDAMVVDYGFSYFVTSIVGANHSPNSYHYAGRAFDVDEVNGRRVSSNGPEVAAFMNTCWALGAIEVFGPVNDPFGHGSHIHCAF